MNDKAEVPSRDARTQPAPEATASSPGARIVEVDALRGFALFGILIVNAPVISGTDFYPGDSQSVLDHVVGLLVATLFETKFYLLFSFLFGYSFVLQMQISQRRMLPFAERHMRRVIGLLLIGVCHAAFLYPGDILTTYSVLGLVLFGVRRMRPRAALLTAAVLATFLFFAFFTTGIMTLWAGEGAGSGKPPSGPSPVELYRGGLGSTISANIATIHDMLVGAVVYSPHIFGAFLVGLAAAKSGVLDQGELIFGKWRERTLGVCTLGVVLGVPGAVLMAMTEFGPLGDRFYYLGRAAGVLTAPALTALYVCCLLAVLRSRMGKLIGRPLAAAGRMSLSNYLGQSLVMAVIFTGYGFAQYAKVGPAFLVLICLLVYSAQLALSSWLVAHKRDGPMEVLLRCITHRRCTG